MAHIHFKRTVYKSGGGKAGQRLEYITRQPAKELTSAARQLRYISRNEREDLVFSNSRNMPAWSVDNPYRYFQAAEQYERAGTGVAFEEWKISLPQELSRRENMALMQDLVESIAGKTLPITYAFHEPLTLDGTQPQPHLHLLISARQNDGQVRTPEQHFRQVHPRQRGIGGTQKDPAFWQRGAVAHHRVLITDVINLHLERAGRPERVHPGTLARRGIEREPEPKLLPSESRDYRKRGAISETMQRVLDIRAQRLIAAAYEQADAQRYWDERRRQLGLESAMSRAESLGQIQAARQAALTQHPERVSDQALTQQARGVDQELSDLRIYHQDLTRDQAMRQLQSRRGTRDTTVADQRADWLLKRGEALGLSTTARDSSIAAAVREASDTLRRGRRRGVGLGEQSDGAGVKAPIRGHDYGW